MHGNTAELPDNVTEHVKKALAVFIIFMDRLTAVATRRHVVERTTEFKADACSKFHARECYDARSDPTLLPNVAKQDLTLRL